MRTTNTLYFCINFCAAPLNSDPLSQVNWNMQLNQHITSNRKSATDEALSFLKAQASTHPVRLSTKSTTYLYPPFPKGICTESASKHLKMVHTYWGCSGII